MNHTTGQDVAKKVKNTPYTLIRSQRRSVSLQINEDATLVVRAPMRASMRYIMSVICKNETWIIKTQQETHRENQIASFIQLSDAQKRHYKKAARHIITQRVSFFASQHGFEYGKIRITSASRRWGSCNEKNDLCFTWKLVLARPGAVDYVVVHELAHTVHKNHGKRFWAKVEKILPEYKMENKWLKTNGHLLKV